MSPLVFLPFLVGLLALHGVEGRVASCTMNGKNGIGVVTGNIRLSQKDKYSPVHIRYNLVRIDPPNTKHGFHVHEFGKLGNQCSDAGGHYNPFNKNHGDISDAERHVGDWGNIVARGGWSSGSFDDSVVTLFGELSIVGRAIVVHEGEDDLGRVGDQGSLTTGNAGARLQCCIIYLDY